METIEEIFAQIDKDIEQLDKDIKKFKEALNMQNKAPINLGAFYF